VIDDIGDCFFDIEEEITNIPTSPLHRIIRSYDYVIAQSRKQRNVINYYIYKVMAEGDATTGQ
jgi:hypothetical protein